MKAEIFSPSTREHYDKLFAGIESCDYKAFNPPFRIEGDPNTKMYQDASRPTRSATPGGVTSEHLFFDKVSYERAEQFFKHLGERIGEGSAAVTLQLAESDHAPPRHTYFTGKKNGRSYSIIYPAFAYTESLPETVICLEGADQLQSELRRHFLHRWNLAAPARAWHPA